MQDRLQERLRAVWRAVRGIYVGKRAETRARRWWSRRDRETARESLRMIEVGAVAGLRPRNEIEWHATILFTCPSTECDATFVIGTQPDDRRCPSCRGYDLERVEYVPRRFAQTANVA